jgi:Pentapeptide repeats (8 copies)
LGREAVSFAELRNRLEEDDEIIKTWRSDQGLRGIVDDATRESVLHELVVNFYFKGGNTSIGCEFLHKSFREYLFAEAIVAVLKDLSGGKSGPLEAPKVEYWQDFGDGAPHFKASRALSRLLAPQWLTDEVRTHLLWLLKKETEAEPERWEWISDLLLDIYIWWAEGVHLRPQPIRKRGKTEWLPAFVNELLEYSLPFDPETPAEPIRVVALDAHLGEALMQIAAGAHALLPTRADLDPDGNGLRANYRRLKGGKRKFAPGGNGYFGPLCNRINAAGWRPNDRFPSEAHLPLVDLSGEICVGFDFSMANIINSNLEKALLTHAIFINTNMTGVQLQKALLRGAILFGVNLDKADLRNLDLVGTELGYANLEGANLERANLERANLKHAKLQGAKLQGENLERADFERADLEGANLEGANLEGANLKGANLEGARTKKETRSSSADSTPSRARRR